MIKWLICTVSAMIVVALTTIGGYASYFIALQVFTGAVQLSSANRLSAAVVSVAVNIALYGSIYWSVKED